MDLGPLPGTSYFLMQPCPDLKPDFLEEIEEFKIPQQDAISGLAARIDTLAQIVNLHLASPTPTCGGGGSNSDIDDKLDEILAAVQTDKTSKDEKAGPTLVKVIDLAIKLDLLLNLVAWGMGLVQAILPEEQPEYIPGVKYTLQGVCENVEEGEDQPVKEREIVPSSGLYPVISRIDAIMLFLQDHLEYKTPTCESKRPEKEGTWVSTRWVSDGDSDNSNRRLRKLFRYRSKSTRNSGQLGEFWRSFTWASGGTIVQHKGGWWGTPQVWAIDADEGKRVIRNAGREAGIDPDQVGEWITSTTDDPRYGMSDTMRLAKPRGDYWATRRDGPTGFE